LYSYFVRCNDVTADGLDSAGCSPKDDEDNDSDDEVSESCCAAVLKPNKISPASGYQPGSSYFYHVAKDKSWLARRDDRRQSDVPSQNRESPEDSLYGQYQYRQQLDDDASTGRGFGANSDAVRQRMMRRKQARQQREAAGLTTADSVAGYRGKDYSIDELMEYIDAKPPPAPKPGQKQTTSRKNRKKKGSSSRTAKSDNGNVGLTAPTGRSREQSAANSEDKLASQCQTVVPADSITATTGETEIHLSSDDGKVDVNSLPESPLQCDTVFQLLPSDGSSSSTSDVDNVSDFRNECGLRNYSQCLARSPESVDMPLSGATTEGGLVNDNLMVEFDAEPLALASVSVVPTPITVSSNVSESGVYTLDNCCSEPPYGHVCHISLEGENCKEIGTSEADANILRYEAIAACADNNYSPPVSESCIGGVSQATAMDSISSISVVRRHSQELDGMAVGQELTCRSSELTQKIYSIDTGQSTSSSSIADAHDFDSQSLADDILSDFDYSSTQTSHENDFTVVTQRKKKKRVRQGATNAEWLPKTFYNRNHMDSSSAGNWQGSCKNDGVDKQSSVVQATVPESSTVPSVSSNKETTSVLGRHHTATWLEVSERSQSLVLDRPVDKASLMDNSTVTDHITSVSTSGNSSSQCSAASRITTQSTNGAKRSSIEHKTREKVFLDTRRPNVGIESTLARSDLSFWYDVNITESPSTLVHTDTLKSSQTESLEVPAANTNIQLMSTSVNILNGLLSTGTCTATANAASCTDSCAVSSQSATGHNLPIVFSSSQRHHSNELSISRVDTASQTCDQLLTDDVDSSGSSLSIAGDGTPTGVFTAGPPVSSAAGQLSDGSRASSTDCSRQSTSLGRHRFTLRDAQLFLYAGKCCHTALCLYAVLHARSQLV